MAATTKPILFNSPGSLYSKKVRFSLLEKNIDFTNHLIDHNKTLDHVEAWFLRMNPQGKIPVLKHGDDVIPESDDIIAYVDKHFGGPKLLPQGAEDKDKFLELTKRFGDIRVQVLTYGSNPEAVQGRKVWVADRVKKLEQVARDNPDLAEVCAKKSKAVISYLDIIQSKEELKMEMQKVKALVDESEHILAEKGSVWLLGPDLRAVDISLGLLLQRLQFLTLDKTTWNNDTHPHLKKYFSRFQIKDSYKKGCCP